MYSLELINIEKCIPNVGVHSFKVSGYCSPPITALQQCYCKLYESLLWATMLTYCGVDLTRIFNAYNQSSFHT